MTSRSNSVRADKVVDTVKTYFGLRTIARGKYGDAPYERILLNGKPIYLRAALDQSFNPKGIYTAPDDDFLRRDLMIAKYHSLNGLRIHIKPDEPRRLYWADKLGLLILEDMPNTWRQTPKARAAWESTMREVVAPRPEPSEHHRLGRLQRDLGARRRRASTRRTRTPRAGSSGWSARSASSTRRGSSRTTRRATTTTSRDRTSIAGTSTSTTTRARGGTSPTSSRRRSRDGSWNFCPGEKQSTAPLINSEYGGVSAGGGDRDISWCFRDLTTLLRRQPKIQGYVYTELTDIEWEHNGFFNYDRTPKHYRLRGVPARHARQRAAGGRLHRLRGAAGDRREAGRDDHGAGLHQPLLEPDVRAQAPLVARRLRRPRRHGHGLVTAEHPGDLEAVRRDRAAADPRKGARPAVRRRAEHQPPRPRESPIRRELREHRRPPR